MAADRDVVRRALRERVARQIEGAGIPLHAVDAAVEQVVAALPSTAGPGSSPAADAAVVATFSAVSMPDLASRVRSSLGEDGVSVLGLGSATVGRHTVVTVLASESGSTALGRAAALAGAALAVVPTPAAEQA